MTFKTKILEFSKKNHQDIQNQEFTEEQRTFLHRMVDKIVNEFLEIEKEVYKH